MPHLLRGPRISPRAKKVSPESANSPMFANREISMRRSIWQPYELQQSIELCRHAKPSNRWKNLLRRTDPMESAISAAAAGATIGQIARAFGFGRQITDIPPLESRYFAEPFEQLRACQRCLADGAWQTPCCVSWRTWARFRTHTARATYAKEFFRSGWISKLSPAADFPTADRCCPGVCQQWCLDRGDLLVRQVVSRS